MEQRRRTFSDVADELEMGHLNAAHALLAMVIVTCLCLVILMLLQALGLV